VAVRSNEGFRLHTSPECSRPIVKWRDGASGSFVPAHTAPEPTRAYYEQRHKNREHGSENRANYCTPLRGGIVGTREGAGGGGNGAGRCCESHWLFGIGSCKLPSIDLRNDLIRNDNRDAKLE